MLRDPGISRVPFVFADDHTARMKGNSEAPTVSPAIKGEYVVPAEGLGPP